jgi:tubulin gamma
LKLFQRSLKQFEKLLKRGAFIDQYKQQPIFKENLDEFDNSKEVNRIFLINNRIFKKRVLKISLIR